MASTYPTRSHAAPLTLTFHWAGVPRVWRLGRITLIITAIVVPTLAVWYLGATMYFVFHDQLLASLISRETDIQYAYEDKIAVLRTQLDRETSRALVDHQNLSTTVTDLASRSRELLDRADALETLVRGFGVGTSPGAANATARTRDGLSSLGLSGFSSNTGAFTDSQTPQPGAQDPEGEQKHVDLGPAAQDGLKSVFASVEDRQNALVERLRGPAVRDVERIRTALAETGLPLDRWKPLRNAEQGVGGPFEPLPDSLKASSFDVNMALLKDALKQRARLMEVVGHVPLKRPLEGSLEVTSPFGARLDPFLGRAAMHTGVDLMEPYGGPVHATAGGIVTVAGPEGGYGNMVEIDHGNGLTTRYAHLSSIEVVPHQTVSTGDVVGRVGSTGRATGPHLHYETRINGEPVDPTRFLRAGAQLFPG